MLTNRGIGLAAIDNFLHTTDEDICALELIDNLEEGAKLLLKHIYQEDDILVQVDCDTDGYCSAAILINYLNSIFPTYTQSHVYYVLHDDKSHGIIMESVSDNIKFVIAPDSSSDEEDKHHSLSERGIDVLVIDHHEARSLSNYACVINNQLCDYPNKFLCGGGMVYKFCSYLDKLIGCDNANNYLDLISLSLVGDMMDLREVETKHLIFKGVENIRNPFLKALIKKQDYSITKGGGLNPFTISWYLAPMINAMARIGTLGEKKILFESMLEYKAYDQVPSTKKGASKDELETRVEQAIRICQNVKGRQEKVKEENIEIIEKIIEKFDLLNKHKVLLIRLDEDHRIDSNLTGLIANQLAAKYKRPTLVLNYSREEEAWFGSGRNYPFSQIEDLKKFFNDTGLMLLAQGHKGAFGAGIYDKDIEDFVKVTDELLKDFDFSEQYLVDFIFQQDNIDKNLILEIASYRDIWGQEVNEPYIAIENVSLSERDISLMGAKKTTIKIRIGDVDAITFKGSEELYEELLDKTKNSKFTFICKCKINEWGGQIKPQLFIEDFDTMYCF